MTRPTQDLTDHELGIMQMFWDKSPQSVNDIRDNYLKKPKPAYNSLLTAVRAIEKKGYLTHQKEGKAFQYSPAVPKPRFLKKSIKHLVGKVFGGNSFDAAVHLLKQSELSNEEIQSLKKLLEEN